MDNSNQQNPTTSSMPPIPTTEEGGAPPPPPPGVSTPQVPPQNPIDTGSAAPPLDIPPVITATPKKKFGGGKIIATILGLLLLVGGIGAGVVLVQQQQLFQQKASTYSCICKLNADKTCTANPGANCPSGNSPICYNQGTYCSCGCHEGGGCTPNQTQKCGNCNTGTQTCNNGSWGTCTGGGICSPGATQGCGSGGTQTCSSSCTWGTCSGGGGGCPNLGEACNPNLGCCSGKNIACNNDTKACSTICPTAYCIGTDGRHASYTLCASNENQVDSCTTTNGRSYYCCKPKTIITCTDKNCNGIDCTKNGRSCAKSADGTSCSCTGSHQINCSLSGSDICVGNMQTGNCYQGGKDNQYACYKLKGNFGQKINYCSDTDSSCLCTCPSDHSWQAHENGAWWCFNTNTSCDGVPPYAERCSINPQQCSGGNNPTPTPGPGAQCTNIKIYDANGVQLTPSQLSALTAGTTIRLAVNGTATGGILDKAQFTVNTDILPETTTKNPLGEFYSEYVIPTGVTSFTINAKLHHSTLGWF